MFILVTPGRVRQSAVSWPTAPDGAVGCGRKSWVAANGSDGCVGSEMVGGKFLLNAKVLLPG